MVPISSDDASSVTDMYKKVIEILEYEGIKNQSKYLGEYAGSSYSCEYHFPLLAIAEVQRLSGFQIGASICTSRLRQSHGSCERKTKRPCNRPLLIS